MKRTRDQSMCGVCETSGVECAICFGHLCQGDIQRGVTICTPCLIEHVEKDENGIRIHPLKRIPLLMCRCGKPFLGECRFLSIMPETYNMDPERLAKCASGAERRALLRDPTAMKKVPRIHWPLDSTEKGKQVVGAE